MNATPSNTSTKDKGNTSCRLQATHTTYVEPFTSDNCALEEKIKVGNDQPKRTENLTIAHQFRTPMTIIQANSELLTLLVGTSNNEIKQEMTNATKRIKAEITRMTNLMNETLLMGKISAGTIEPKREFSDLKKVCTDLVEKYNSIQEDNREVDFSIIGESRNIFINSNLMSHAISNLISNALKYSEDGNPELELVYESDQVKIHVSDTGIGIPKDEIQFLFAPFHRAANVGSIPGTGLGLSIVLDYVEMNEGTVAVESIPNERTTFTITIPTGESA
jgi:signal transduction histidine kinase